jgi:hypothetical protein
MAINTYPNLASIYPYRIASSDSDGALSVVLRNREIYLDLSGQPFYLVGYACDTCEALFERVRDLQTPLAPQELSDQLRLGLTSIPEPILESVLPLLPKGDYIVGLIEVRPTRTTFNEFAAMLKDRTGYLWWHLHESDERDRAFELVLPAVDESQLNAERIAHYRGLLEHGHRPTALALSMLEERFPGGRSHDRALVHFLLDGHHKVMAASQLGQPIVVLSFLRESWPSGGQHVDVKLRAYYECMAQKLMGKDLDCTFGL